MLALGLLPDAAQRLVTTRSGCPTRRSGNTRAVKPTPGLEGDIKEGRVGQSVWKICGQGPAMAPGGSRQSLQHIRVHASRSPTADRRRSKSPVNLRLVDAADEKCACVTQEESQATCFCNYGVSLCRLAVPRMVEYPLTMHLAICVYSNLIPIRNGTCSPNMTFYGFFLMT